MEGQTTNSGEALPETEIMEVSRHNNKTMVDKTEEDKEAISIEIKTVAFEIHK